MDVATFVTVGVLAWIAVLAVATVTVLAQVL
jgi:hypothetical protein